jgi:hypothetical protein
VTRGAGSETAKWELSTRRSGTRWAALAAAIASIVIVFGMAQARRSTPSATLSLGAAGAPLGSTPAEQPDPRAFGGDRLRPVGTTMRRAGAGPVLPGAPDLTILAADGTGLHLIDTDTGDLRRIVIRRPAPASLSATLFVVGDHIVVDADNDVAVLARRDVRPTRVAAGHRAVPTFDGTSVWVFDKFTPYIAGTASRVGLDGTVHDQITLPAVVEPVAGTADGLLVSAPGAVTLISPDGQRRQVAQGMAVATDGHRLAWLQCAEDLSCAVNIGTTDDAVRARTQLDPSVLPAGYFGLPSGRRRHARMTASFSPDGRWLALPLHEDRGGQGRGTVTTVAIIDTATGTEVRRLEGSSLSPFDSPLAWSPDSAWLVHVSGRDLSAWRAADDRIVTIDVELTTVRALAVR